jgi:hypothetical protein
MTKQTQDRSSLPPSVRPEGADGWGGCLPGKSQSQFPACGAAPPPTGKRLPPSRLRESPWLPIVPRSTPPTPESPPGYAPAAIGLPRATVAASVTGLSDRDPDSPPRVFLPASLSPPGSPPGCLPALAAALHRPRGSRRRSTCLIQVRRASPTSSPTPHTHTTLDVVGRHPYSPSGPEGRTVVP